MRSAVGGRLLYGGPARTAPLRLDLDESGAVVGQEELLQGEAGRLRHVAQAPTAPCGSSRATGRPRQPIPDDDRILASDRGA